MPFTFMFQVLLELAFSLQHYISKIMMNSEEPPADKNIHRLAGCPTKMNPIHEQPEKSASFLHKQLGPSSFITDLRPYNPSSNSHGIGIPLPRGLNFK